MKEKERIKLEEQGYDLSFIAKTQPQGNVHFYGDCWRIGNGYVQELLLYKGPSNKLENFWLKDLVNEENTFVTIDVATEDTEHVKELLDRAQKEVQDRQAGEASKYYENADTYASHTKILNEVMVDKEIIKRAYIRVYVYSNSREELDKHIRQFMRKVNRFKLTSILDEQESEFRSMWLPAKEQKELPAKQMGINLSAKSMAGAYFINKTQLADPYGSIIGVTWENGLVNFNPYYRDGNHRTRPFVMILGNPGFGKSTLMKVEVEDAIARGHRLRIFDTSNEYSGISNTYHGLTITMDGSRNHINPFEVIGTVTKDREGKIIDVQRSFEQHIDKLKSIYAAKASETGYTSAQLNYELNLLDELLTQFYRDRGMWNPEQGIVHVVGLPHNQYPLLSDWVTWLDNLVRSNNGKFNFKNYNPDSLQSIRTTFTAMLKKEGAIFDHYTDIPDISAEQLVTFDVESLAQANEGTYNAVIYSMLSLIQMDTINNGKKYRTLREQGKIELRDVPHTITVLDEAEKVFSSRAVNNVRFIVNLAEQMRKNFAGIFLAAPSIQGLLNTRASMDKEANLYNEQIEKLVGLMNYRIFFASPDKDLNLVANALGSGITAEELENIPKLSRGQCLLNIAGDQNIWLNVIATKAQLARFKGGD